MSKTLAIKTLTVDKNRCSLGSRNLAEEMKGHFREAIKGAYDEGDFDVRKPKPQTKAEVIQALRVFISQNTDAGNLLQLIQNNRENESLQENIANALINYLHGNPITQALVKPPSKIRFDRNDINEILGFKVVVRGGRQDLELLSRPLSSEVIRDLVKQDFNKLKIFRNQQFILAKDRAHQGPELSLVTLSEVYDNELVFTAKELPTDTIPCVAERITKDSQSQITLYPFPLENGEHRMELINKILEASIHRKFDPAIDTEYSSEKYLSGKKLANGDKCKVLCITNNGLRQVGDWWYNQKSIEISGQPGSHSRKINIVHNGEDKHINTAGRHFVFIGKSAE